MNALDLIEMLLFIVEPQCCVLVLQGEVTPVTRPQAVIWDKEALNVINRHVE